MSDKARIDSLSAEEKRALLKQLVQKNTTKSKSAALSFAQQRLWYLYQLEPESTAYHTPAFLRLQGKLQLDVLIKSLNALVARHEALRTTFDEVDGQARQIIAPEMTFSIPVVDLKELPQMEREAEAKRLAALELNQVFDLKKGPLLRATILRLANEDHILLLVMHHIITDGWSMGIFMSEWTTLYRDFCAGLPASLPKLDIQYADFAKWQRDRMTGEVLEQQLSYWENRLAGAPALLELPTDRPRPPVRSYAGAKYAEQVPNDLIDALKSISHQEGVTLFVTLLAAFQLLLGKYSGQQDICVGSPIAGRNRKQLESLIGFFVNTLVFRTDLSGNPSFRELLSRVRSGALDAYANQDLPFEKVIERLNPERSLSHSPLFQVMFTLQNIPSSTQTFAELTLLPFEINRMTTTFDLTLTMQEGDAGGLLLFEYNTDLFDAQTIARMTRQFLQLLAAVAANPDQKLGSLSLLTKDERNQLLYTWNETVADYPRDLLIHQIYQQQAEETPDAIAVLFGEESLTYGELNSRANQLAHYLQKRGIGAGSHVGICTERSLEMVVSMLGVLKAGAAYVPLDLTYPTDRLNFMIEDAHVSLLLALEHWTDQLPQSVTERIFLDADWKEIEKESTENLQSQGTPVNTAYLIYTSGSTGKPKGVCVPHRGCVRLVKNHYIAFEKDLVFLNATTISFDASVFEIWGSLLNGARLALLPPQTTDVELIGQAIEKYGVTTMCLTTSLFNLMVDNCLESLRGMKHILVGGDVVSLLHVRKALQLGTVQIYNAYGPTESATIATTHPITMEDCKRASLPIGRPIANTTVYILDEQMQPVPIGVPGELYIGGDGVANGYLNRPELTTERFIPHPFSDEPSAKLYKTGDLVRYLTDGNIEFLGRLDNQVKIRGFRIELGEVEAALAQHPAVQEAIVIVREDLPGDKRIVAYLVLDAMIPCTNSDLRQFLSKKLPHYMVPSAFVMIDNMPLTPNGKIDRKALPKPDFTQGEPERVYVAPRTDLEQRIHARWAQVLGAERIGVYDNFFDVGGQSLLATQLIFRLREEFQAEIPLRVLLEKPTISGMAEMLEQIQMEGVAATVEAVDTKDLRAEVVLDEAIQPAAPYVATETSVSAFRKVLLTGATGFLGAFLLRELLEQTKADIYCLVRATDAEKGMQRIRENLEHYGVWNEALQERILPVIGDFAKPLLGLTHVDFRALAQEIDVIYHNGALVNTLYPYAACKAANVLGTEEILRLASLYKVKPVHFVSTMSVFPASHGTETKIATEDEMSPCEGLMMGYAQSKWVAEQLMDVARTRGIPTTIYRCGRMSGHSQTGACQTDDTIWRIVKGCIQLGLVPDMQTEMDMSPVDFISRSIVHLSRDENSLGKNYHLMHPNPPEFHVFVQAMQSLGFLIRTVSVAEWMMALQSEAKNDSDNAAAPLGNVLMEARPSSLRISTEQTQQRLAQDAILYPAMDVEMLKRTMSFFMKIGFLETPGVSQ